MSKIELIKLFDQNSFDTSSSEEELVFIRSKWDCWHDHNDFLNSCRDYAWGDLAINKISILSCRKFCNEKLALIKDKYAIEIPEYASSFFKVCDDWNCEAVMWKEKSFFYLLCWSTTA